MVASGNPTWDSMIVTNVRYHCVLCKQPLTVLGEGETRDLARGKACREAKDDHVHVRCDRCSPPGWAACVQFKVEVRET